MALTVDDIRVYTKDIPELNVLLEGVEQSSDGLIALAMRLTVSDFNAVAPSTYYVVDNFPSDIIMLYGVLHHLANAEAEKQLRNNVNFSAQGLQAGIDDKQVNYTSLSTYYKQLFDSKVKEYKNYLNTMEAWGGVLSPYSGINTLDFRD